MLQWLTENPSSPFTRRPLTVDRLFPNVTLCQTLDAFHKYLRVNSNIKLPDNIKNTEDNKSVDSKSTPILFTDDETEAGTETDRDALDEGEVEVKIVPPALNDNLDVGGCVNRLKISHDASQPLENATNSCCIDRKSHYNDRMVSMQMYTGEVPDDRKVGLDPDCLFQRDITLDAFRSAWEMKRVSAENQTMNVDSVFSNPYISSDFVKYFDEFYGVVFRCEFVIDQSAVSLFNPGRYKIIQMNPMDVSPTRPLNVTIIFTTHGIRLTIPRRYLHLFPQIRDLCHNNKGRRFRLDMNLMDRTGYFIVTMKNIENFTMVHSNVKRCCYCGLCPVRFFGPPRPATLRSMLVRMMPTSVRRTLCRS